MAHDIVMGALVGVAPLFRVVRSSGSDGTTATDADVEPLFKAVI